jgi:hypothetical protein
MRERRTLLIGMVLLCVAQAFGQDTVLPNWHYTELDLTLSIAPDRGELHIIGKGEIEVKGAATSDLRLRINGDWLTLKFVAMSVGSATVETNLTDPAHKAWRIASAHFAEPVSPSTHVPVQFEIVKEHDAFPLAVKPNVAVAISDAVWYPVPIEGSVELPPGKMTFQMPVDWHAAPMGTLISVEHQGARNIEIFEASRNRRRAFIAAPYKIYQSKSATGSNVLYLLAAPIDEASLLSAFDRARKFLESKYGPLPFRDYQIAEMPNDAVPWYGSSEEGLIISRNEMMRSEEGVLGNLVHELAHSWWGNKVSPSGPGGSLLNEGMASFSGMAFLENISGRERTIEGSEFGSSTGSPDATVYGYMQIWRAGKDTAISQLKTGVGDHYNIAQSKGVWVLRMLSDRIGQERFYATLRQIIANDPTLTLATFRKAMESAAPEDQGLPQFLGQWLDQPGIPILEARWRNETKDDKVRALVSIFQAQAGDPYTFQIDLKLRTRKGVLTRRVEIRGIESRFEMDVPDELVGVELDPSHKLLIWRPEFGAPPASTH